MKTSTFGMGGVHPEENKLTADVASVVAPIPRRAVFPLQQHIGVPARAVVGRGDKVKVGTLIAEAGGFVSAPIYSSVSGIVSKIEDVVDATGYRRPAIIVDTDGDEWDESIDRSDALETLDDHPELSAGTVVERIKNAGITGMGGAGFPTFIKLMPPPGSKAECVIINAAECEPYITSDYRLMMEHADEIVVGVELLMKAVGVDKAFIGIEENKPKAIELFEEKTKGNGRIVVVSLKGKYPQGGEKQLVDAVIGRQVPRPPAIPVSVGAIVQNVGTAFAVYQAVMSPQIICLPALEPSCSAAPAHPPEAQACRSEGLLISVVPAYQRRLCPGESIWNQIVADQPESQTASGLWKHCPQTKRDWSDMGVGDGGTLPHTSRHQQAPFS